MIAALITEATKALRATVVRATTIIMVLGIALICSSMLLAAGTDDPELAAKLGPLTDPGGWEGYLATAAQVTAAASLLGFGVVLSWLFGREFADGTIGGLFALPVRRSTIAAAKLVVYFVWAIVAGAALVIALVVFGWAFGLGPLPADAAPALGRQFGLALLTAAIAAPVAWAATLGRSALAGIATAIGILVVAQVAIIAGAGGWLPLSAPGLWAVSAGTEVTGGQLSLIAPLVLLSAGLTMLSWRRLQLDR
jgi:ABC-2 type transport system permease protein